jgi:hypothetical protein
MRHVSLLILTMVLLNFASYTSGQNISPLEPGKYFAVGIEQGGKLIPVTNHQVSLQKQSFSIVLFLKQPDGILVNASLTAESFEGARTGKPFKEIRGFTDLGMAEDIFNPQAMLILAEQSPHYWYYESDANHRFNEVTREQGVIICKRIVANLLYRDTTREYVSMRDIRENDLYLVFMKTEWTQDFSQQLEQQREYLHIRFQ